MEFHTPDTPVVAPSSTVTFTCIAQGNPLWVIDDEYIGTARAQELRNQGFFINATTLDGTVQIWLEFSVTVEYNQTSVSCSAGSEKSDTVVLIVAGTSIKS